MAQKNITTPEQARKAGLQLKRKIAKHWRISVLLSELHEFNPPTCRACGNPATAIMESDGACGDAECCPQTDHVEYACTNLECETISERP